MRDPAEDFRAVRDGLFRPWRDRAILGRFMTGFLPRMLHVPRVPIRSPGLMEHANVLARLIRSFSRTVVSALMRNREAILDRQLVQEPIAEAAMELYASICVLSRRDAELAGDKPHEDSPGWHPAAAEMFLRQSAARIRAALKRVKNPENAAIVDLAKRVLDSR
jgi:hypothetical protein